MVQVSVEISEEPMKRVPERFELDEDDIKEAITEWLNEHHNDYDNCDYTIEFKTETKEVVASKNSAYRGPIGGMSDPVMTTVITAIAHKDE